MTVSTAYTPLAFSGNGSTTAFSVSWPFFTGTLVVTLISSAGVETVKTLTTHYTVSGGTASNGLPATGTVTMLTAPASGETLRITRVTTKTQASTWAENDPFPQKTIEAALDKLTLLTQEAAAGSANDDMGGDVMELVTSGATDYWDGESHIIRNVADAVESGDAVNYGQVQDIQVTAGAGDVVGPASATTARIATFNGATGKIIADGGKTIAEVEASAVTTALAAVRNGVSASFDTLAELAAGKAPATSGTSVLKGDGSGGTTAAAATDLGAGKHALYIPAAAMTARTTNGAAAGTVETTTNKLMFKTLDYDTTTQEFAQFSLRMPKSWNESTVTAAFTWSHAATITNFGVVWAIEGVALSDDDAGDTAFGTAQQIADTGGTTNDIYVTSATPAMTIAGSPAAEDWVVFQVKRVPSDGSDTMAIDARLHGVTVYLTTDAITDD